MGWMGKELLQHLNLVTNEGKSALHALAYNGKSGKVLNTSCVFFDPNAGLELILSWPRSSFGSCLFLISL